MSATNSGRAPGCTVAGQRRQAMNDGHHMRRQNRRLGQLFSLDPGAKAGVDLVADGGEFGVQVGRRVQTTARPGGNQAARRHIFAGIADCGGLHQVAGGIAGGRGTGDDRR